MCIYRFREREREQHPKMTIGFKWKLNRFGFGRPFCDMSQVFTENKTSPTNFWFEETASIVSEPEGDAPVEDGGEVEGW